VYEIEQTETFSAWFHIVFLLCGGDKRTQEADIKQAHKLAKEII
jgi:putative component of toxin-antitoxin plasmid stabilization module